MKLIGSMVIIAIAPMLLGFQPAEGLMNVKITTATHIPGPPSYSCPNGVKVDTISINFTASRIANNTGGTWDIMAAGPAFKNGTIQNVTISKNNYYILGTEIADNICKDSVPVNIIIYGQCNLNRKCKLLGIKRGEDIVWSLYTKDALSFRATYFPQPLTSLQLPP